jgi:hypothetical protein
MYLDEIETVLAMRKQLAELREVEAHLPDKPTMVGITISLAQEHYVVLPVDRVRGVIAGEIGECLSRLSAMGVLERPVIGFVDVGALRELEGQGR